MADDTNTADSQQASDETVKRILLVDDEQGVVLVEHVERAGPRGSLARCPRSCLVNRCVRISQR